MRILTEDSRSRDCGVIATPMGLREVSSYTCSWRRKFDIATHLESGSVNVVRTQHSTRVTRCVFARSLKETLCGFSAVKRALTGTYENK